jgi:hypothetical protein
MYFVGQVDVYQADFNAERQARERIAGELECLYVLWFRWMCTKRNSMRSSKRESG